VLEILLAARGHRVPTDRLGELVWGDDRPRDAAGSLQTFVSSLRRHLTSDRELARALVVTEPEAYRFATDLVELDLDRFDELVERSARESPRKARRSLEEALTLVRGDVLEDEPYSSWAVDLRGSYQGRVLGARLEAADGHIPGSVWWVIIFLGVLTVGFTAFAGMRSLWVHFVVLAGFTATIVIVVALIMQLDYPFRGEISVSADPFAHVLSEVGADLGAGAPSGAAR